jgi:hypothetical protein
MYSFYVIESKILGGKTSKTRRIKLSYLHYPTDNVILPYDSNYNSEKEQIEDFLKTGGFQLKGYAWDEKKSMYIFLIQNYLPLRLMARLAKETLSQGRSKDLKYYNAAQKHERDYLPKRKNVTTYKKKKQLAAGPKILNATQMRQFKAWIKDGNATEVEPGLWLEQSTQYKKQFDYEELQKFFKREYL